MSSLQRILDSITAAILAALLLFMPLSFGAVQGWSSAVVVGALALAGLLAALKLLDSRSRLRWSWAYLPVSIFLLLVVLQLLPMPAGLVAAVSPHTAEARRTLLASLPNAPELLRRFPLSLEPWATRRDLRTLLCAAAMFVIVVQFASTPGRVRFLLIAIAAAGGIIAALALAQDLTHADKLYWRIPGDLGPFHAVSGPFVNHSHFGQFMNLSMGAGLALLLPLLATKHAPGRKSLAALLVLLLLVGACTIIWSRTRGGVISMAIASLVMALAIGFRRGIRSHRGLLIGLVLAGVCGGAVFIYFIKHSVDAGASGRFQLVKDALAAWRQFPVAGIGLGAHENVFPMFDSDVNNYAIATHVENEYAQALEETGVVGLAMVLLFLAIVARQWWVAGGEANQQQGEGLAAFGLGYGLVAVLVHSFTDFGQHLPANACLTAATCGLIVAVARLRPIANRKSQIANPPPAFLPLRMAGLLAVIAVGMWAMLGALSSAKAQTHWTNALNDEARLRSAGWSGPRALYADLTTEASTAASIEPDNITYRYWLATYLWRAAQPPGDQTGELPVTPKVRAAAANSAAMLEEALPLCPTYGPAHALLGQLRYFTLGRRDGATEIELGYRLAPYDANVCFAAGVLAARTGRDTDAVERFRHALRLNTLGEPHRLISIVFRRMRRPDLAVDALNISFYGLTELLHDLENHPEPPELVAQCRKLLDAAIRKRFADPDAPAYALSHLAGRYFDQGDFQKSLELYQRAAALAPDEPGYRLAVAQCLQKLGRSNSTK